MLVSETYRGLTTLSKNGEKVWLLLERVLGGGKKLWKRARLATERKA